MANTNSPNGFGYVGLLSGSAPNDALAQRLISSSYSTAIFTGDPVVSLADGTIGQAAAGTTTPVAGIFDGCEYYNASVNRWIQSPYWPGSGATGSVIAKITNAPDAVFVVQSNNTAIGTADIGANIDFAIGTGNTATGISGATVNQSTIATTSTLPFRIVGLYSTVGNGGDASSAYNRVLVAFNNQDFKSLVGVAS